MSDSVVITGLGPITAYGVGVDPLWEAMIEGRSAIDRITAFDPTGLPCQVAATMPDDAFDIRKIVPKSYRKATKVMCRDVELAVGAAARAVEDAGLVTKASDPDAEPTISPDRFGCHIGAGLISADVDELAQALMTSRTVDGGFDIGHWGEQGMHNLTPLWLLKYLPNMLACHVTIVHDCRGPSNTITCCEASSGLSIGESLRVIQRGDADACLTGGAEYKLNPLTFLRQIFAGRLAKASNGVDPGTVVRPFDPSSTGTVVGEGGGLLVLESAESARRRGAKVYCGVASFAASQSVCTDATGLNIDETDASLMRAMQRAIERADLTPDDVDAIIPLGSGVPNSDAAEARAIRSVYDDRTPEIPIVTTVPFTGNCAAGNGAVAMAIGAMCLTQQKLPARLNTADAGGLNAAAGPAQDADLRTIMVSTTSQGGQNVVVMLRLPAS